MMYTKVYPFVHIIAALVQESTTQAVICIKVYTVVCITAATVQVSRPPLVICTRDYLFVRIATAVVRGTTSICRGCSIVLPSVLLCCMHEMPPPAPPPPPHTMKDLSLAQAREDKEKHSEAMQQLLAVAHGKN